MNFDNAVQDFTEKAWKDIVCDGFAEYKTFWEKWVGTRPSTPLALIGYELTFDTPLLEEERTKILRDTSQLRTAHYGVFVNLAATHYYIIQLGQLLEEFERIHASDRNRLEELASVISFTLDSCWSYLGRAFFMVFRLTGIIQALKDGSDSYDGGLRFLETILEERGLHQLWVEVSELWYRRIQPFRTGYTHIHPHPVGMSGRTWSMPTDPLVLSRTEVDPTMLEQSGVDTDHVEVRELLRMRITEAKRAFARIWPVLSEELERAYGSKGVRSVYIESEELAAMLVPGPHGSTSTSYEHATPIYTVETVGMSGVVYPPASGGYNPSQRPTSPYSEEVTGSTTHRPVQIDGDDDV